VVVGKVPYGGGRQRHRLRHTGLIKVVGESRYGELLGRHIVGSRATGTDQELVNIRALEGGFPELARIVHGHPTLSEAVMEAGRAADGWLLHGQRRGRRCLLLTAAFYFDLASPVAYLAAERVLSELPGPAEWRPVMAGDLPGVGAEDREQPTREQIESRARELGLQPLRWPAQFPFDSTLAMRAATYAGRSGAPFRSRRPPSARRSRAVARWRCRIRC
jgi:hypothetical protein